MIDVNKLFYGRKPHAEKLKKFGFGYVGGKYIYCEDILNGLFKISVTVEEDGGVSASVYDNEAEDNYYLYAVDGAEGTFVGAVRAEYDRVLSAISENCFTPAEVYREATAKAVIAYAESRYGTGLEFLWHDENSVMRRPDNRKWFMAVLPVKRALLGIGGEGKIEAVNLMAPPEEIERLIDGEGFFPAYHMNKKSWITVALDGRVPAERVCAMVETSYNLAGKKK